MRDCEEYVNLTAEGQDELIQSMDHNFDYVYGTFAGLKAATVLIGLAIVFVVKK